MNDIKNWESKFEPCIYSYSLLYKLEKLNEINKKSVDIDYIRKAIFYAKKYHGSQLRKSGEPYYSHPLEVASMIADYLFDTDVIVISILHDVLEDTNLDFTAISQLFSPSIAEGVLDLTREKDGIKVTAADCIIALWNQHKYALLIVKLFDRLHNIRTIGVKSPKSIEKITKETLQIFISVAIYFGLREVEEELSTICVKFYNSVTNNTPNDGLPYGGDKQFLASLGIQNVVFPT